MEQFIRYWKLQIICNTAQNWGYGPQRIFFVRKDTFYKGNMYNALINGQAQNLRCVVKGTQYAINYLNQDPSKDNITIKTK